MKPIYIFRTLFSFKTVNCLTKYDICTLTFSEYFISEYKKICRSVKVKGKGQILLQIDFFSDYLYIFHLKYI